ncbi:phospholipase D family protein [Sphingomonas sp. LB-2]|uniref:phospholipase D family protein n=1 Tax=Sphingomonas caeni TaxID=2984949 RepID=UPI00222EA28A|nr:phospholipase D family protein [Sphingomonas caeni]MCW3845970.1 phospholipase D family protein [Sphingomonas caeni]
MKLLDETDALSEIRDLLRQTDSARLAVAFWGKGAIERLGLDRLGLTADILCNLDSGACNPAELRRIRALPGITLKSHPSLHAKVYWTPQGAVIGSSNASANGLALEGDAAGGWREANVRLDGTAMLDDIVTWFDTLFAQGNAILDEDLERAEQIWKTRAKMAPTGTRLVDDLVTAFTNAPAHPVWRQIKLAYWMDGLPEEDEAWLEAERSDGHLASGISAYGQWNDRIAPQDWVIDFDVSGTAPRYDGIWRALPEEASRPSLRLVYKAKQIRFPALGRLTLARADAAALAAIAPGVLAAHSDDGGRNALIDLATALGLIAAARTVPSEKGFTKAMEQIYDDAVAIGYRPSTFRRMLAEHGGVETARRLIRGAATSGFEALWEKKRLDLSVEALMLKPGWRVLFRPEELAMARKRLRDVGYAPEE